MKIRTDLDGDWTLETPKPNARKPVSILVSLPQAEALIEAIEFLLNRPPKELFSQWHPNRTRMLDVVLRESQRSLDTVKTYRAYRETMVDK